MAAVDRTFNAIIERCRLALSLQYCHWREYRAEPLLDAELRLIRLSGLAETLVEIVTFGDRLREHSTDFHVIGAGGSSVILYLLGFSEVDPIRYGTHFQRFWTTSSGAPPIVQFVVLSNSSLCWVNSDVPNGVRVHPMTALETVPELLGRKLPGVSIPMNEPAVFEALQDRDTDGIFQFDAEPVRSLMAQVRPSRVKSLAIATALAQISHSFPHVVGEFLDGFRERSSLQSENPGARQASNSPLPILFQETIMERLRRDVCLPGNETYRFIQVAAKSRSDSPSLRSETSRSAKKSLPTIENSELLDRLALASRWAVCRAHHVANAITSYRAAYYRTFYRPLFDKVLQQVFKGTKGI